MTQTHDPQDDASQATAADIIRVGEAAIRRSARLRELADAVRAVALLLPSMGAVAVLVTAANELAQLAGGPIEVVQPEK